ncbi:MAG TPA: response regulator [Anaerolineales bacterium]|nr:response regulator [Anaerolineales bacterium]
MSTAAPRVYIIDEHEPVRHALAGRLGRTAAVDVVGDTGDAAEAVREADTLKADVVLVEIKRGDGMGLELVRQLATIREAPKVVVLTSYPSDWEEAAARRAGAEHYLLKEIDPEELIQHILACTA